VAELSWFNVSARCGAITVLRRVQARHAAHAFHIVQAECEADASLPDRQVDVGVAAPEGAHLWT